ncbi:MAG: antibiotic biosynthesis monooxygenase [Acidobacteria bacterium]|nr:antibiotic biosynthesis monooxygenase [Acidobacteriota bacterium]
MYIILWEFRTKASARRRFVRAYGSSGSWARLFRNARGYVATRLMADPADNLHFLTVDVWRSRAAHTKARRILREEYASLDALCEKLTTLERHFASFEL